MVYSARSFSPLECEAVIAAALEQSGGSVVLESSHSPDGSIRLAGGSDSDNTCSTAGDVLKVRPGWTGWRLPNLAHPSWRQTPDADRAAAATSAADAENPCDEPSAKQPGTAEAFGPWYATHAEAVEAGSTALPSYFPPKDLEIRGSLQRCARLLPHDNDSDGCFVAVLKRVAPPSADPSAPKAVEPSVDAKQSKRGAFSVPVGLRAALSTAGGGGAMVLATNQPHWRSVQSLFGFETAPAKALGGCVFLTDHSERFNTINNRSEEQEEGAGGRLGSVYAASAAAAEVATCGTLAVVHAGSLVIVPSSVRAAVTQSEDGETECCTHRLAEGSAGWVLNAIGPRVVEVSGLTELIAVALGEVRTVDQLGEAAQATQSAMAGGCVVYMAAAKPASAGSCGLGVGMECVVGWKTATPGKLMVFVSKSFRQLATERRAAFGLSK